MITGGSHCLGRFLITGLSLSSLPELSLKVGSSGVSPVECLVSTQSIYWYSEKKILVITGISVYLLI